MMHGQAGDRVAQQPLQEGNQGVTIGLVLEYLLQVAPKARAGSIKICPLGGSHGPQVVAGIPIATCARLQVKHAIGHGQQPGVRIPHVRGDAHFRLHEHQDVGHASGAAQGFGPVPQLAHLPAQSFILFFEGAHLGVRLLHSIVLQLLDLEIEFRLRGVEIGCRSQVEGS